MSDRFGSADFSLPPPDESEDWKAPAFSGDFYREQNTVCRGLTLSPQDVPGLSPYKDGMVDGDFYRESDDICKGLSLGGAAFASSSFEKELGFTSIGFSSSLAFKEDASKVRFQEGDVPPAAPTDSFFKFEVTSLFTSCSDAPFKIGNDLLDVLAGQVTSVLNKVRRPKFSIKADVFDGSMMCTLKIRVYSQEPGRYAVEFQRRMGDTISFNNAFRKACDHLSQKPYLSIRPNEVPSMLTSFKPPPLSAESISEADLRPILDMAGLVGAPWLQAEAAVSLNRMASEGQAVVRNTRVFQAIADLLQTSSTEIALPTACLICQLAEQAEASRLFASSGLLPQILEKVRSPDTNAQIRHRLAQALCKASQLQSPATLPQHDAAVLLHEFSETLRTEDMSWGSEVIQNLQMANLALRQQEC